MTDTCPAWPTLLAWFEGDLDADEWQSIASHVEDFARCQGRLALTEDVAEAESAASWIA